MGGMGGSLGYNESTFKLLTAPGAYGDTSYDNSARLSKLMEGMIGNFKSNYSKPLEEAILRPDYTPTSASETSLLDSLMTRTAGKSAISGMGAPTQASLAASIAPTLIDLRQKNIDNLAGARSQDIQISQGDLQALAALIKLAMPQTFGGNDSWGFQTSGNSQISCWVAREVYGYDNPLWLVFREWLLTSAPKFVKNIYLKYGEKFARFISNKPFVKMRIKGIMDRIIIKFVWG